MTVGETDFIPDVGIILADLGEADDGALDFVLDLFDDQFIGVVLFIDAIGRQSRLFYGRLVGLIAAVLIVVRQRLDDEAFVFFRHLMHRY